MSSLPGRLKAARIAAGKTKEQSAVAAERSYPTIVAYESGAIDPPIGVLITLARFYGTTIGALLDEPAHAVA